jgi:hypothetical protein
MGGSSLSQQRIRSIWSRVGSGLMWTVLWAAVVDTSGCVRPGGRGRGLLVLLDGYDRVVAMEMPGEKALVVTVLRVSGDLPKSFVKEVAVSYGVRKMQMHRFSEYERYQAAWAM